MQVHFRFKMATEKRGGRDVKGGEGGGEIDEIFNLSFSFFNI